VAVFSFGSFVLDVSERRVTHAGKPLVLTGKTFDVLRLLVEARGRLVERETFAAKLWAGATVEQRNLTVHVSTLRKGLMRADPSVDPIETVARSGYRLALPVHDVATGSHDRRLLSDIASLLHQAHEQLDRDERVPALKALTLFERVLVLDPDSAEAHAGLAVTYLLLSLTRIRRPLPMEEAAQLARDSAGRALALDGRQAEAWTVLGQIKMLYAWDWAGAEADLAHAVAVGPRSAHAHEARGLFLSAVGRHDEAILSYVVASELTPRRSRTLEALGLARWSAGDGAGGLATLNAASSLDPTARRPHFRLMVVLDQLGRHDEAMAARCTWLELFDDAPFSARLMELHRSGHHRTAMVEWIARLNRLDQHLEVALQSMVIDDRTASIAALQRCVDTRADGLVLAGCAPSFRPLAGDPRYEAILRTLGLHRFAATT